MPTYVDSAADLKPGDFYEDCAYHPCLCIQVSVEEGWIAGVSLVDGSYPRGCSIPGCGVRKLTFEEAMHWKFYGPTDAEVDDERKWVCHDDWQYWPEDRL